ncbi:MAG TPA: ribbon-helix-helix protein, CopG family [bacterium]|nr:ribbon-helix-helix protein, CopG family [bacterium]
MVRAQIQLSEKQAKQLKKLAAARDESVSSLIRQAVQVFIRVDAGPDAGELRDRAIALAGKYRSGKKDVSARHDDYLAKDFGK